MNNYHIAAIIVLSTISAFALLYALYFYAHKSIKLNKKLELTVEGSNRCRELHCGYPFSFMISGDYISRATITYATITYTMGGVVSVISEAPPSHKIILRAEYLTMSGKLEVVYLDIPADYSWIDGFSLPLDSIPTDAKDIRYSLVNAECGHTEIFRFFLA